MGRMVVKTGLRKRRRSDYFEVGKAWDYPMPEKFATGCLRGFGVYIKSNPVEAVLKYIEVFEGSAKPVPIRVSAG